MALKPKIAGEKWRRFHRDERVEPRSLIKSNWETNIWYRVYSPEKINPELSAALGEGCGKGGEVSGGSQEGLAVRTQSLTISFFQSQGKVSQPMRPPPHWACLTVVSEERISSQGMVARATFIIPKSFAFFSTFKCAWLSKHHLHCPLLPLSHNPRFSRLLFLLTIPSLLPKFRAFLYIKHVDCFWWQEFSSICYKNHLLYLEENSLGFEINQGLRSVKK